MPDYYSGNYFLSLTQMQVNALYLYGLLDNQGWTLNAISGLLGNTQTESTHNPGIWQNLTPNRGGYGLTQWTPYTKYTNWCAENGYTPSTMQAAAARLKFEVEHPSEQWVVHDDYPMTFREFTQSEDDPYTLAMVFLNNYEMPANLNQPKRGTQAQYWYEYLSGEEPPDPPPGPGPGPGPSYINSSNKGCIIPTLYISTKHNRNRAFRRGV